MGRAPCCEKIGLKKGPWTPEEDSVLINFIQKYGHGNWRALPKLAGLLRCGKSCRLRWTNYLRPDIKRGNFTREEEDTIIQLHQVLGNRWSAIAGKLPGRTDNEIKNVWHTHLKKRLNNNKNKDHHHHHSYNKSNPKNKTATATTNVPAATAAPPRTSSSCNNSEEMSSSITAATTADASSTLSVSTHETSSSSSSSIILHDSFPPIIDDTFWSAEVSDDQLMFPISNYMYEDDMINNMISNTDNDPALLCDHHDEFQMSTGEASTIDPTFGFFGGDNNNDDTMNFWYNIFMGTGDIHLAS